MWASDPGAAACLFGKTNRNVTKSDFYKLPVYQDIIVRITNRFSSAVMRDCTIKWNLRRFQYRKSSQLYVRISA